MHYVLYVFSINRTTKTEIRQIDEIKCRSYFVTVERRDNEPLYNEVLGVTNDFLYPSNSKISEKEPRYREQILPYLLALRFIGFPPCTGVMYS